MGGVLALGYCVGCGDEIFAYLSFGRHDCNTHNPGHGCRVYFPTKYVPNGSHQPPNFLLAYLLTRYFLAALVAAQAHSSKADRAVVISSRNFLRSLGGACGLAVASALFSNTLVDDLPPPPILPEETYNSIMSSVFSVPDLSGLSEKQKHMVLDTYMMASRSVFYFWVGCISICWLLIFFIRDRGLQRKEEKVEEKVSAPAAARGRPDEIVEHSSPALGGDEGSTTEGESTTAKCVKLGGLSIDDPEAAKEPM